MKTGSVLQRKGAGRPQISEEEMESVRVAYTRSPRSPFARLLRSYRSHAPLYTKFSQLLAYKVQLLQALKQENKL